MQGDALLSLVQGLLAYHILYCSSTRASWPIEIYFPKLLSSYVVTANIVREYICFILKFIFFSSFEKDRKVRSESQWVIEDTNLLKHIFKAYIGIEIGTLRDSLGYNVKVLFWEWFSSF